MESAHPALVRREELARELGDMLSARPLATLHGPPGSGKSSFLSSLVAYPNLSEQLRRCGRVLMISLDGPAPGDPPRQRAELAIADMSARALLGHLSAQLGVDLPEPPETETFAQGWAWVANPQDERRAPGLLLIDGCERITDAADWLWLAEHLIKPLVDGPTPLCRIVCAQHRPVAWPLPELQPLAGALAMQPFGEGEVAAYVQSVLDIRSPVLTQLLLLCTAGFPLGLAAWQAMLGRPAPAPPAQGEADDPRLWLTPAGALLATGPALLVAGAALLRSFDKAALAQVLAPGTRLGQALAIRMGAPYTANARPAESRDYVRARKAMQDHGWLAEPDLERSAELVSPSARDQIYALLAIDDELAEEIDCALADHYRTRIEADPFRAQAELIDWLYFAAGRRRICADEWGRADQLFSLLCAQLGLVLRDNPFADLRVLSDLYTERSLLERLHERGVYAEVERQFQRLVDTLSATLAELRGEGLRLQDGQEIRDERLQPPRNSLLRLAQQAFGSALRKVGASAQAWDLAVGPLFESEDSFSRAWLQERDSELYDNLQRSGLIVGRSVNSLAPMVRAMLSGERTLAGRLGNRQPATDKR